MIQERLVMARVHGNQVEALFVVDVPEFKKQTVAAYALVVLNLLLNACALQVHIRIR